MLLWNSTESHIMKSILYRPAVEVNIIFNAMELDCGPLGFQTKAIFLKAKTTYLPTTMTSVIVEDTLTLVQVPNVWKSRAEQASGNLGKPHLKAVSVSFLISKRSPKLKGYDS